MAEIAQIDPARAAEPPAYKTWLCALCGFIYNERDGKLEEGIPPGTRWEDMADDWVCPDCGTAKSDFDMIEI